MPELDIQRQENRGVPIWAWILGAVLLALLIWWIVSAAAPDRQAETVPPPQDRVAGERQELPGTTDTGMLPVAAMLANPASYSGNEVSGTATVADVVSDRGFWVEQDNQRAFVLVGEGMAEADVNVEQGQQVRIQGTFMQGAQDSELPEMANLEPQAQQIVREQPGFIRASAIDVVEPADGHLTQPGMPEPGTTEPGMTQPGTAEPGMTEPDATKQPGTTTAPGTTTP